MKGIFLAAAVGVPMFCAAQAQGGISPGQAGLQGVLDQIYTEMLPQCTQLIGVGQAIAGFAALWYIGRRVWPHIARAETVDVYSLLRPFCIGIAIVLYPYLIALMNAVLSPTVTGTASMQKNANDAIALMLQQKEAAMKNSTEYQMYVGPDGEGNESLWESMNASDSSSSGGGGGVITNLFRFSMAKAYYSIKSRAKVWMSEVLQLVYQAAVLCINTIRTFNLLVLAILGPLVLGLSVFDGFQGSLRTWAARYINVYLWLPVANIFGSIIATIQVNMLKIDINQLHNDGTTFFSSTDIGYLLFMIIGIVGYFTVPSVAGFIVQAGGGDALTNKVSGLAGSVSGGFFRSWRK